MRETSWAVCVAAAAVVAVGGMAGERAAPVFHELRLPPSNALVEAEHAIRQRVVGVDLERFGEIHRRVRQGVPTGMALNLWEDAAFDALIDRTRRTSAGYSLSGRLAGVAHGAATLVVNGDVLVGTVWTPAALYDIRTVNGAQVLREVNMAALPPLAPPNMHTLPPRRSGASTTVQPRSGSDDGSVIDVLVVWTAGAAKKAGGVAAIRSLIDLGVAAANDAYARSGVRFRLSLVGAEQADFPDLNDENAPPFSLSELAAWYEELAAQYDGVIAMRSRRRGHHQYRHGHG